MELKVILLLIIIFLLVSRKKEKFSDNKFFYNRIRIIEKKLKELITSVNKLITLRNTKIESLPEEQYERAKDEIIKTVKAPSFWE